MIPLISAIILFIIAIVVNFGISIDEDDINLQNNQKILVNSVTLMVIIMISFYFGTTLN